PGQQAGYHSRQDGERGQAQVGISSESEFLAARPKCDQVKLYASHEKGNRKVDQHDMLRVLCEKNCARVEGIQRLLLPTKKPLVLSFGFKGRRVADKSVRPTRVSASHSLHDDFGGHLRMDGTEVRVCSGLAERKVEFLVRI